MERISGFRLATGLFSAVAPKHATPVCYVVLPQHTRRAASTNTGNRRLHTTPPAAQDATLHLSSSAVPPALSPTALAQSGLSATTMPPALSCLPLSQVLRTYLITSISSSPLLLRTSTRILRSMLESRNPLTSIDRNPLLRSLLWHTFYRQFCAGETPSQVARVNAELRAQGYSGVILEYALEVLKDAEGAEASEEKDVGVWRRRMLETVAMASPGDFVGLKWSGMGPAAMRRMKEDREPSAAMEEAMHALCAAARDRRTSLLPAAEETWSLSGFFNWTMEMQRVYNAAAKGGECVVYSTYQAYLKQTPETISRHLALARKENFTLGLKLVRGAYLGSEDRALIHPSIEATHAAYDGIMASLIQREPNARITTPLAPWPNISVVLATHNAISVQLAQTLRRQQLSRGEPLTQLSFAQLQGMADEVSCTLIAAAKAAGEAAEEATGDGKAVAVRERVYKCTTWGSMGECLNYLLRRAAENKDAAGRTQETRRAMRGEIGRRVRGLVGLA
ncbi:proline dehydrogenase [Friedmanniomyces endolithicus]|uniref:Proline dehydrogenase n=1 Tax=Friedmanniomyces endolithicus TaxID=329885 RepID=A0AAN6FHU7_9PEZI|nr:proline dehydrogenase [Friedmanniomyces endolithicus]KAK0318692.1 proline dehydrogenase [Friedmanniomyces endolithicus]KAK1017335.1 proline dehydrogenase [Friedmanniomyces endolithicus]